MAMSYKKRNTFHWLVSFRIADFRCKVKFFHPSFNRIFRVTTDIKPQIHFFKMLKEVRFLKKILQAFSARLKTRQRLMILDEAM